MFDVQKTTAVTIDQVTIDVSKSSDDVQAMVGLMDKWRQEEVDVSHELLKIRGAIRDIQNSIVAELRKSITSETQAEVQ
jgi:hypothetical protein